ncbi:MAG: sulfurtransferase [Gammaproteobacteria bacterium]|nr:sulfurtransferase [Gammaproteobacteria bacterium]
MDVKNILMQTTELAERLDRQNQVIVDLCKPEIYTQAHIPGARFIDYATIVRHEKPVMGLIPTEDQFSQILTRTGITPDTHVVAYDDEGGGKAARFLWTLMLAGHQHLSLLDGGLHAWSIDQLPLSAEAPVFSVSNYPVKFTQMQWSADAGYILKRLGADDFVPLDARSPGEYMGTDVRASRAGHIPGAINYDWVNGLDRENGLRLHPAQDLLPVLESMGFTKEKEIVVYCHSHHRSALSFFMLLSLGYERVRGYPGSWSDWGNREDTPVEV